MEVTPSHISNRSSDPSTSVPAGIRRKRSGEHPMMSADDKRLREACSDFEGVFLNLMLQSMKKTLPGDGVFGNSHPRGMYDDLFYQEITKKMARDRGVGVGDGLYRQLRGKMEKAGEKPSPAGRRLNKSLQNYR